MTATTNQPTEIKFKLNDGREVTLTVRGREQLDLVARTQDGKVLGCGHSITPLSPQQLAACPALGAANRTHCLGRLALTAEIAKQAERMLTASQGRADAAATLATVEARAEAKRLAPADTVICQQKWSNGDLMSACYITDDDVEIIASDQLEPIHHHYYTLPRVDYEAAKTKRDANIKSARRYQAELIAMDIPASARADYRRYNGDAEAAWERADEAAWAAIRKYGEAIETQAKR